MHIYQLLEALKPSQYRNIIKGWDKNKLSKEFQNQPYKKDRNAYRIFIPVPSADNTVVEPNPQIKQFLDQQGFEILDYTKGQVKKKLDGRIFRLGKVLPDELKQTFANDPSRQATKKETLAVISRHPYDIAGMSTDRGWTSCQNLVDGSECEFIPKDIKHGTIIAYEITKNDLNINKPLGRVLIKPYINHKRETAFGMAETSYGTVSKNFMNVVKRWIDDFNKSRNVKGLFVLHGNVYPEAEAFGIHGSSKIIDSIQNINTNSLPNEIIKVLTTLLTDESIYNEYQDEMQKIADMDSEDLESMIMYHEDDYSDKVSARDTLMPKMVEKVIKIIQKHPKKDEIFSMIFKDRNINITFFDTLLNSDISYDSALDKIIQNNVKNLIKNAILKRNPKITVHLLMALYSYGLNLQFNAPDKERTFIESMDDSSGFIIKGTKNYDITDRFKVMLMLKQILPTPKVNEEYNKIESEIKQQKPREYRRMMSIYS